MRSRHAMPSECRLHTPEPGGLGGGGVGGSGGLPPQESKPKIQFTSGAQTSEAIEARWKRPLHATGSGANHVRTFTGKLNTAGLEYLDKHINEWLDTHPDAEVKFATMTVGELSTSLGREPTLVVQVWI